MDVTLLVYDLSRGLARQMSMGLLGFQLDAIYHTSIELSGREYVYDGGILAIAPGSSHLGQPMERIRLGSTSLSMDVIEEYIDSLRPIFTAEAYDLFHHNCNNFSDTLSNFLLGKGIPSHISSMPQAVLDSPMGRMLVPQLVQGVNANRQQQNGSLLGLGQSARPAAALPPLATAATKHSVKNVSSPAVLARLLDGAARSCAVIFFTSATCAPCRTLYPIYDELAEELGDAATLIRVDISLPQAQPIASEYAVRATPTFVTFLKGVKEREWLGADAAQLRGNVRLLATMAAPPQHPHERLRLPTVGRPDAKPVLYAKVPPLDKLIGKMGVEVAGKPEVAVLRTYLEKRAASENQHLDAIAVPEMRDLAGLVQACVASMPPATQFPVVDLFRCSLADPRISGYFAEEAGHKTVCDILASVQSTHDCPYALRLVTLQMACNLFSTPLFAEAVPADTALRSLLVQLVSSSFLDDSHTSVRVAAASLLFNVALADQRARRHETPGASEKHPPLLTAEDQVELAASVVEAIGQEETSGDALRGMLLALGHLVYCTPLESDLADLLRALDAEGTIAAKKKAFPKEALIAEVGAELLGKGLQKP